MSHASVSAKRNPIAVVFALATSFVLCMLVLAPTLAFAAEQGPQYPSAVTEVGSGSYAWSDASNIATADALYATTMVPPSGHTNLLIAKGFGFQIPAGAIIDGITVTMRKYSGSPESPSIRDEVVRLTKNGSTTAGSNLAKVDSDWINPGSFFEDTYGGAANLWGQTWSAGEINSPGFGVALQVQNLFAGGYYQVKLDYIRVTVSYHLCGGPSLPSAAANIGGTGTVQWGTPDYVCTDEGYAAMCMIYSGQATNYLRASDYRFIVPAGATIDGIELTMRRYSYPVGYVTLDIRDRAVNLSLGNTPVGESRGRWLPWQGGGWGISTYGGPTDLWGRSWTVDEVNSPDFGTMIAAGSGLHYSAAVNNYALIDWVRVQIYYTIRYQAVHYVAGDHGSISGETSQSIQYGLDGTDVTAEPAEGYHFVRWSDDILDATRHEASVTADATLTAEFAVNNYTIDYVAGSGGTLSGPTTQTVDYGSKATTVTAVAGVGYRFSKWTCSDGTSSTAKALEVVATSDATWTALFTRTDAATLKWIRASAGSLSPAFAKTKAGYTNTIKASTSSSTISVATTRSTAKVRMRIGSGSWASVRYKRVSLSRGATKTVTIKVTSSDGKVVSYYTVQVHRKR